MDTPSNSQKSSKLRWIAIAINLVLVVIVIVQWHAISQMRQELESLRAQTESAPPPVDTDTHSSVSPAVDSAESEQLRKEKLELARLLNEIRQARQQLAVATSAIPPIPLPPWERPSPPPLTSATQALIDEVRHSGLAVSQGDSSALENLAKAVSTMRTMKGDEQAALRSEIRKVFETLGLEAGKGNTSSLQALWQATRMKELDGFAVVGLGQAAGQGNEEALRPLLDPENYHILRSSAVGALKPAADAGNPQAISALAATAADPKQQALWMLAAQGLAGAASAGNPVAIDGLATLAASQKQGIAKEAVFALEAAARKGQFRAEEALQKLGWRGTN
jgi:hypothetical protein